MYLLNQRKHVIKDNINIYIYYKLRNNYTVIKKTFDIIICLLNESEKKGIGNLKSLNGLVKGEVQNLLIYNELTYVSDNSKKLEIKIESHKTIIDLKIQIAKCINTSWD